MSLEISVRGRLDQINVPAITTMTGLEIYISDNQPGGIATLSVKKYGGITREAAVKLLQQSGLTVVPEEEGNAVEGIRTDV